MSPDPNTKLIICPNCGAQFNVHEPRCPYCDHLNPAGAEEKYMRDLEETRLALDQVDELAGEEMHAQAKKGAKRTLKVILIAAAVILLLFGVFWYMENRESHSDYELTEQELAWQREVFPEWDALYAQGRFDELADTMYPAGEKHRIWDWSHYEFISWHTRYRQVQADMEQLKGGSVSAKTAAGMIYSSFQFYYRIYASQQPSGFPDEEELARLEKYREEALQLIHEHFHFTDAQMEAFRERLFSEHDVLRYESCEKLAKEYYKTFN